MRRAACAVAALAVLSVAVDLATAAAEEPAKGQVVFEAQKCGLCHRVPTVGIEAQTSSEKLKGPDLVNLAASFSRQSQGYPAAKWMATYLRQEAEKEGESHSKPFKGSDEELQALVDWLLEQKAEG